MFHHLCHDLEFHPSVWMQGWPENTMQMLTVPTGMQGSLMTVAMELERYKLDLVGVQEVRWDKGGTAKKRGLYFFV